MDWRIIRSEELGIMSDNILLDKSKAFALRIIKMYKYLTEEKKEYIKELTESMLNAKYIITNCEMASKFNKENLDIINIGILMYSLLSKESNSKDVIIREESHISTLKK